MWKTIRERFQSSDSYISMALGLAVVLVIGMLIVRYVNTKKKQSTAKPETETQQTLPVALPTNYVVKQDDTLWSIAESFYKSGYNWVDIAKANTLVNPDRIDVDQTLTIPDAKPIIIESGQVSSGASDAKPEKKSYMVVRDDTLWDIATKEYGDAYKWSAIAQANNLANPDLIFSGNVLVLPE